MLFHLRAGPPTAFLSSICSRVDAGFGDDAAAFHSRQPNQECVQFSPGEPSCRPANSRAAYHDYVDPSEHIQVLSK